MAFELQKLSRITNNLDSKRIPLNEQQRKLKESRLLYPYIGANNILGYIDDFIFNEKIICIAEDGGSWGANEKCAFIVDEKCWVNNHAHVLTAKENLHLEYLCYYLNYVNLNKFITGSTRGKLTKTALNTIEIPLPPLSEQQRIAAILDAADSLRKKTQQIIDSYDELAQSVFLDMFGDPVKNEKGWERKTVGDICEKIQIGPFGSQLHKSDYNHDGIPLINPTNIIDNKINFSDIKYISPEKFNSLPNYHLKVGDIIMARRGDLSKVGLIENNQKLFCGTGSLFISFKRDVEMLYIHRFLADKATTEFLMNQAQGITMPNLNKSIIKKIPVNIPPQNLQAQFAQKIELIEKQKELAKQSLKESEDLFQSLLQKAFKGELNHRPL